MFQILFTTLHPTPPHSGALLEKKTDLDKRSLGISDYSNGLNKPLVCRPSMLSKDPSDRNAFLDKVISHLGWPFTALKNVTHSSLLPLITICRLHYCFIPLLQDGVLSNDAPPSPFMPSPSLKLPLANSSLPGQGLGPGNSGLAMQNLNNRQVLFMTSQKALHCRGAV